MAARENLAPGAVWFARDESRHGPRGADGAPKRSAGEGVMRALSAGAVGDERLAPAVNRVAPRVDGAAGEDIEAFGLGPKSPDAAAVEPAFPPAGIDEAVDVNRLVEIQLAPGRPAQGMDHVVDVRVAEPREDDPPFVRAVVAIGIGEEEKLCGAANIGATFDGHDGVGD